MSLSIPVEHRTIAGALDHGTRLLKERRPRSPRLDAEVLLAHVLDCTRTQLYARGTDPLDAAAAERFESLLQRRREGEPVAHLVGWKEFYGRRFEVTPDVLIPRPETEFLAEAGMQLLERTAPAQPDVLDLCTGSGAVAITLALELPQARVWATDLSPEALAVAGRNVQAHAVTDRVRLAHGDLFDALTQASPGYPERRRFDLIVANPPYVGTERGPAPEELVVKHEPSIALFAGPDGMEILRRLITEAPDWLVDGGCLALEVAAGQSEAVEALMQERGFRDTGLVCDLQGLPRVVLGHWEER